jgi:multidrug efflux system outer membrane protein
MGRLHLIIVTILAGFVMGCSVGPTYHQPDVPVPAGWVDGPESHESLANLPWWELFDDPEMQGLIRTALDRNKNLQLAAARVEDFRANLGVVRSNQFPQLQATASAARTRLSEVGPNFVPGTNPEFNVFNLGGDLTYQTDFWGLYRRATEQARANLLASEQARLNVVIAVVTGVAQAYFQLRQLDLQLEITQRTAVSFQDSLKLTQIRFEGGVASELDVRQAQTALFSATSQIPVLQEQIVQQENGIRILLGENPGPVPRGLSLADQRVPPGVPAGLPSQLLERRPDVRQAEEQLAAAYAGVGVAKAQFFPQLPLTATAGFESVALSTLLTGPARTWEIASGLTQPLFAGGRLKSTLAEAKAIQKEAQITYEATVQQAFADVENGLIAYTKSRAQLAEQRSLVEAAADALRLANVRYVDGVAIYLDVLDSQRQLFNAEMSQAQTRGAVLLALVQLYKALGGGW